MLCLAEKTLDLKIVSYLLIVNISHCVTFTWNREFACDYVSEESFAQLLATLCALLSVMAGSFFRVNPCSVISCLCHIAALSFTVFLHDGLSP